MQQGVHGLCKTAFLRGWKEEAEEGRDRQDRGFSNKSGKGGSGSSTTVSRQAPAYVRGGERLKRGRGEQQ